MLAARAGLPAEVLRRGVRRDVFLDGSRWRPSEALPDGSPALPPADRWRIPPVERTVDPSAAQRLAARARTCCHPPFGQTDAAALAGLAELVPELRTTPWRAFLSPVPVARFRRPRAHRRLPGAPACASASVPPGRMRRGWRLGFAGLHVSGCAKGCAHPGAATHPGRPRTAATTWSATAGPATRRTARADPRPGHGRAVTRDYIRDGAAIYAQSFATIRAEADLSGAHPAEARVAVRIVHAAGMSEVAPALRFSPGFADAARAALRAGAPILCDAKMVAHGITRARLPAGNEVLCTLDHPDTPALARRIGNTRSAAALELWGDRLGGAVVAIGNAPTALFHLLDLLDAGAPRPAAIIGLPVGFVGAAESKDALWPHGACPAWCCRAGAAAAPWRWPRSTRWRATPNDRDALQRRRRPRRPGTADAEGGPHPRRRPGHAFFAKRGRPEPRPGHRRRPPAPGRRGAAVRLPVHDRDRRERPALRRRDDRVLRGSRRTVAARLDAGSSVALLCEGDPFFYGSAMYVFDRLRPATRTRRCPA